MLFMVNMTYPITSVMDIGKEFLTSDPLPDWLTRPSIHIAWGGAGIKQYVLYEAAAGHEQEAVPTLSKRMLHFNSVPGVMVTVEPVMTMEEAFPLLGIGT
jgi:hypothetical protein